MIKVLWELDEAVALLDLYIKNGKVLQVPDAQLIKLGEIYKKEPNNEELLQMINFGILLA